MITFEELNISPSILKALYELGFENPMPVQEKVIPLLLEKNADIVALAQTGTGKTAAFGIPLIQQTDLTQRHTQFLILAPTRELCVQIADDLNDYAKYIDQIRILPVYGGTSIEKQLQALKKGVHIIVATPGRLGDLIQRRAAKLDQVRKVVLDEADEMLNMGFVDSINEIFSHIPESKNTLLFSATMSSEVANISRKYMKQPVEITIGKKNVGAENVQHICYVVHAKDKYQTLKRIADFNPDVYGIVFCRTRIETQEIADKLIKDGYNADSLHGDLSQAQRDYVMQKFRNRSIQILVATDVAARGLDVDNLTHVINYNLPDDTEIYTHRSGRTGRAGKPGISIAIVNLKEKYEIRRIEKLINKQFIQMPVPTGREICEKQLFKLIDRVEKVEIDHTQIESYLPAIYKKLEWIDKQELIQRFVSLEFNRFLNYYRDAVDITDGGKGFDKKSEKTRKESPRSQDCKFSRIFLNIGKSDKLEPANMIGLVVDVMRGSQVQIGKIDLLNTFSYIEVEGQYAQKIVSGLNNKSINNRSISANIVEEDIFPEFKGDKGNQSGRRKKDNNKWNKSGKKLLNRNF